MKITATIDGADLVKRALLLLDSECHAECIAAVDESSAEMMAEASARVPVKSGVLKSTIRRTKSKDGMVAWVQVGEGTVKRKGDRNKPGVQALVIEVGSADGRHPAEPFMGPASEITRPRHEARIEAALNRAAEKAEAAT